MKITERIYFAYLYINVVVIKFCNIIELFCKRKQQEYAKKALNVNFNVDFYLKVAQILQELICSWNKIYMD